MPCFRNAREETYAEEEEEKKMQRKGNLSMVRKIEGKGLQKQYIYGIEWKKVCAAESGRRNEGNAGRIGTNRTHVVYTDL